MPTFGENAVTIARGQSPGGDLVPGRAVADAVLSGELDARLAGRPAPNMGAARDTAKHLAILRVMLGGHAAAAVGQGQPWQGGTPAGEGKVLAVIDTPAQNGASRSCAYLRYAGGQWDNGLGEVVDGADVVGWIDVDPENRFLVYLMGSDLRPAARSPGVS